MERAPRPCGVISRTKSSTSIFSMPLVLMTSARDWPAFFSDR